jgi:hypothetical protein
MAKADGSGARSAYGELAGWWWQVGERWAVITLAAMSLLTLLAVIFDLLIPSDGRALLLRLGGCAGLLLLPRLSGWLRLEHLRIGTLLGLGALIFGAVALIRPTPTASQSALTFVAAPRISKATFTAVLRRGTGGGPSPAAPAASSLYDIFVSYGIDPGVALAFFAHESQLCTVGVCADYNTNNWGAQRRAVKPSRVVGVVPGRTGTFVRFGSWEDGARDWSELILGRYVNRSLDTVDKAVPVYAPSGDGGNVPVSYIRAIYRYVGSWQGRQPGLVVDEESQQSVYEGTLDEALIIETFLASEIEYHPEWAFHQFMVKAAREGRPLGAPMSDSRTITVGGKQYAIQVFAYETLFTQLAADPNQTNWNDVRRLSDLMAEGGTLSSDAISTPAPSPTRIPGMILLPTPASKP